MKQGIVEPTCHHPTTLISLIAFKRVIEMFQAIHGDRRAADLEESFAEQPYCPDCRLGEQGHVGPVPVLRLGNVRKQFDCGATEVAKGTGSREQSTRRR